MEIQDETMGETTPPRKTPMRWASVRDIGHLLRLQWPKYLVDILVIILGITISFMLDSRKEESNRQASEQVYLKSLLADITSDIDELNNHVITKTKEIVNKADAMLVLTDQPDVAIADVNQFAADIFVIMERPNFTSKDATFSDLRSSGNMQLITNVKLKTRLFEYYRLYESMKVVETAEREVSNTIIAPYLLKRFSIKSMVVRKKPVLTKIEWKDVLRETEFSNTVSLRLINRQELLEGYQNELDLALKIKTILESQIK